MSKHTIFVSHTISLNRGNTAPTTTALWSSTLACWDSIPIWMGASCKYLCTLILPGNICTVLVPTQNSLSKLCVQRTLTIWCLPIVWQQNCDYRALNMVETALHDSPKAPCLTPSREPCKKILITKETLNLASIGTGMSVPPEITPETSISKVASPLTTF